jgi:hypothetical protein
MNENKIFFLQMEMNFTKFGPTNKKIKKQK